MDNDIGFIFALKYWLSGLMALRIALFSYRPPLLAPEAASHWPLHMLVPLIGYGMLVLIWRAARPSAPWFARGTWSFSSALLATSAVLISGLVLYVWAQHTAYDYSSLKQQISTSSGFVMTGAFFAFATCNAALEEFLYRGLLYGVLAARRTGAPCAIILTALSFGALHYYGIPSGLVGVGLATLYGFILALLRYQTGGLLVPWLTHVCADAVIFFCIAKPFS